MTRRLAPSLATLLAAPLALLISAQPVAAVPELALTPPSGQPGDPLTAIAVGFTPGSTITFLWNAQPDAVVGTATADDAGRAVLTFSIPAEETTGAAVVRACADSAGCPPGTEFADATVDVLSSSLLDEDGSSNWLPLLLIALMALILGGLTGRRLARTTETFKPPPPKKHDHELDELPEGRSRGGWR